MKAMRRQLRAVLFGLLLGLTGCDDPDPGEPLRVEFQRALPSAEVLWIDFPGSELLSQGMGYDAAKATLEGLEAGFQRWSLLQVVRINGGLAEISGELREVVRTAPPAEESDSRVRWQSAPEKLPQRALVIDRDDFGFTWQQLRKDASAAWGVVLNGTFTEGEGERGRFGQGALQADLDADDNPETSGMALALWSEESGRTTLTVYMWEARFDTKDYLGEPADRVYHTVSFREGGGSLVMRAPADVDERGPDREDATIVVRWNRHGAGRGDLTAEGGDVGADGYARARRVQCWGPAERDYPLVYEETFLVRPERTPLAVEGVGDPADCAFDEPASAALPPLGDRPDKPAPVIE